jgi:hypothetical protein
VFLEAFLEMQKAKRAMRGRKLRLRPRSAGARLGSIAAPQRGGSYQAIWWLVQALPMQICGQSMGLFFCLLS